MRKLLNYSVAISNKSNLTSLQRNQDAVLCHHDGDGCHDCGSVYDGHGFALDPGTPGRVSKHVYCGALHRIYSLFLSFSLFFSTSPFCISSPLFFSLLFARLCGTFATVDTYRLRAAALHGVCMFAADRSILSISSVSGTYTASLKVYTLPILYIFGSCRSRMLYQAIVTRRHYRTTLDPPLARALLATIVAFTARL